MSLRVVLSNRFKNDLKLAKRRGLDLELLNSVVTQLASGKTLDAKYRDHDLGGNYAGFRECHIKPDWLLIYRIDENRLILFLNRTGSHADLFE
ncbi:type II toxin-antitoxin system YafQ family toxin [uncultured Mobiluncus sp.]|uniref:type II toxin-antitoxin system YafQ family toxin n=1 Tax=uncultured Mobiluncus sp. TaxID=293425 RepID=UPI002607BF4E|nr:type II toxin-antitoxin system YafQ family toxin [uncultured Mobiluncus sp.]